jgi:hypothetical protein
MFDTSCVAAMKDSERANARSHGDGEIKQNKNIVGFGCTIVPPLPRTCCRPRWGVWGGWETATQPQPPWNLLWSNLI